MMISGTSLAVRAFAAALMLAGVSAAAEAKCARLAFSVNDYGKDGPTKDAKALLDKHIVTWTAQRGIAKYSVGKKDVSCELFLDFGFFDEHTCKASATVCWADGPGVAKGAAVKPAPAAAAGTLPAKAPAPKATTAPAQAKPTAPAKPAQPKAAPVDAPAAPPPAKVKPKEA